MTANTELALLQTLDNVGDYAIPKKTLFAEINIQLPRNRVLTHADFETLLYQAQDKGRIQALTGEDGVTIKITTEGRHRLAELRR